MMQTRLIQAVVLTASLLVACGDVGELLEEPITSVCEECVEVNTAPPREVPDPTVSCTEAAAAFTCTCTTQDGDTESLSLTSEGCVF